MEPRAEPSVPERPQSAATCRNCGNPAASNFCPECGQATRLHPLSMLEFVREVVSHYVATEGKLWRTLALLTLKPGRLTIEYLAGRRQRYIVPLRLYLSASFIFFALAQLTGMGQRVVVVTDEPGDAQVRSVETGKNADWGPLVRELESEGLGDCLQPSARCAPWKRWFAPAFAKLKKDPGEFMERFAERWRHSLSYAMFCLLPIFAALLALAYRNRRMYYGEHLVFALHVHSFWFLLAAITEVLLPDSLGGLFPAVAFGYGMWALHRVYRGRLRVTALRGLAITTVYALIMGIGSAALSIALLAT